MLALVKKPHIELSLHGEQVDELVDWIRKKYDVSVLSTEDVDKSIPVEETEFWKEMEKNRVGNLLAAARLKAGLTQGQLAKKLAIRQNMVSDYERGRRTLSSTMAKRFANVLHVRESYLKYGGQHALPADADKPRR
jgi:ribosome-binding protein aMBF1 (putative translation factor)